MRPRGWREAPGSAGRDRRSQVSGLRSELTGEVGDAGKVKTTGQDASLEGVQNVILGTQGVTVFKDFRLQAPAAAKIAAAVLNDTKPTIINAKVSNGQVQVPSVMLKVVPIGQSNVKLLVTNGWIKSQFGGLGKVCKGLPKVGICK